MSEQDTPTRLAAALAYARRGWAVHPVRPGDKRPLLKDWPHQATTDQPAIRAWWARWPEANVGLACGPSGALVVDLDVKGGADGPASWVELAARLGLGELMAPTSRTPSGGRHLFFAAPDPPLGNSTGRLGPGIDTRGQGGYVLLPPSALAGGQAYTWEISPGEQAPCPLPPGLVALLSGLPARAQPRPPAEGEGGKGGVSAYARAALSGEVDRVAAAAPGTRNNTLNTAAYALGQLVGAGTLEQAEVEGRLLAAALSAGLEEREAQATIASGLDAGRKQPRPAPCASQKRPRPLPDAGQKEPQPLPDAGQKEPRPLPDAGQKQPQPLPDPGRKQPRPAPHAGQKEPQPLPDPGQKGRCPAPGDGCAGAGYGAISTCPATADRPHGEGDVPPLPDYARLTADLGGDACPPCTRGGRAWLDDYIAFSRTWSPRSFDGFHEACGLWLLSTVAARRVVVHYGRPRYTNLYLLLAGRTTLHAKSSATDIARGLLRACGLDYLLAADEATPQAFVRALAGGEVPANWDGMDEEHRLAARMRLGFCGQRGWYAEEFGSWLASMTRTDGVMADFRGLLRKLDDCPPDYSRSTIARGAEVVQRPYLALIANLTPADLRPVARRGAPLWGDGFLARFAFITPPQDEVLAAQFPKGERPCPPELTGPLVAWHRQLGLPRVQIENGVDGNGAPTGEKIVTIISPEPQECALADEVWDALHRYNMGLLEIAGGSELTDLDGNYGRLHEKALRVAALLASMENSGRVELRHWARAQEVAERWRLYAHRLYEQVAEQEPSLQAEIEEKVADAVRRWQGSEKYPGGLTAADIARFLRGLGAGEVKRYADQMVGAGLLAGLETGRALRYTLPGPEGTVDK